MVKTVWIVRHGYRADYDNRNYAKENTDRPNDPPLTNHGFKQAKETARFFKENSKATKVYCSPFLRTVQTGHEIAVALNAKLYVEECLREWIDGNTFSEKPKTLAVTELSSSASALVDGGYESLYHPQYPESPLGFMDRCKKAIDLLIDNSKNDEEIVTITHASTLVGLARSLSKSGEIRCGLCSIVKLTYSELESSWKMEMNGTTTHLSSGEEDPHTDLPYDIWKPVIDTIEYV